MDNNTLKIFKNKKKINVFLQDRVNPRVFNTYDDEIKFLCPICKENGKDTWVIKNMIDDGATFFSGTCHCDMCESDFSLNK